MATRRGRFTLVVVWGLLATVGPRVVGQTVGKAGLAAPTRLRTGDPVVIQVVGDVSRPLGLTRAEFARLPRQTVRSKGHDGVESQYEGVALLEVLAKAGVPTGKDLRGPAMALYVVVEAADGYRAVFALSELDPAFTDRVILLADRRDGRPLAAREGAFQVVVPGEKKHARWVRQVTRLKVGRG